MKRAGFTPSYSVSKMYLKYIFQEEIDDFKKQDLISGLACKINDLRLKIVLTLR